LGDFVDIEILLEALHAANIGDSYTESIGRSYPQVRHASRMAMKSTQTFYDRAMQAAAEKFGRELTQTELAALVGIKQPSVAEWRVTRAKIEHAQVLSAKTGHCVQWLYNGDGPRHPWDVKAQRDPRMQELLGIWNQLTDEGKSRLLGAATTLLQDFRDVPPQGAPPAPPSDDELPQQKPPRPRRTSGDGHSAD
jgi:hypothetical protein